MEANTDIEYKNHEFLKQAMRFCREVGSYIGILELDPIKVHAFISNKIVIDFAIRNQEAFKEFSGNSMPYNIETLRTSFNDLVNACKRSKNYTKSIGSKLGIENSPGRSFDLN